MKENQEQVDQMNDKGEQVLGASSAFLKMAQEINAASSAKGSKKGKWILIYKINCIRFFL